MCVAAAVRAHEECSAGGSAHNSWATCLFLVSCNARRATSQSCVRVVLLFWIPVLNYELLAGEASRLASGFVRMVLLT